MNKQAILEKVYEDSFDDELSKMAEIGNIFRAVRVAKDRVKSNRQYNRTNRKRARQDRNIGKGGKKNAWAGFDLPGKSL